MIAFFRKLFIKDPRDRRAVGSLCGIVGVCFNVLLCAMKLLAGGVRWPLWRTGSTTSAMHFLLWFRWQASALRESMQTRSILSAMGGQNM